MPPRTPTIPATSTTDSVAAATAARTAGPSSSRSADRESFSQRTVRRITDRLARSGLTRRGFLFRTALVGSALAVDPTGLLLRPRTAWATVCGADNECNQGWSAFCATINDGANTCPDGSFTAGWWKIDNSDFCSGRARYIIDCNEIPPQGSKCSCRCADGECDRRRVCCNDFRYGQCNTQIPGTTPVVCRIVLCTPPWVWDDTCTTTSLTSNQTLTHWSAALPSRTNPTPITVRWLEMGLTGSVLGDMVGSERDLPGASSWAEFDNGVMTYEEGARTWVVTGAHGRKYEAIDGPSGPLGHPREDLAGGDDVRYRSGHTYRTPDGIKALWGRIDDFYRDAGGLDGWLGAPRTDLVRVGDTWRYVQTGSRMHVVRSVPRRSTRILRLVDDLPSDGSWPATASVSRWSGPTRIGTAVELSRRAYPDGSEAVLIVSSSAWPDAAAAGAISARLGAPILLVGDAVPSETRAEIQRLGPSRAVVVGGPAVIPDAVVSELGRDVATVERWSGSNRFGTARDIATRSFPDGATHVFLATGTNFPDSLTVGPLAAKRNAPLLLSQPKRLPGATATAIDELGAGSCTIIGGTAAVSSAVESTLVGMGLSVDRIAGSDRYHTARLIARDVNGEETLIATGTKFPDALAASSYATRRQTPILLVNNAIPTWTDRGLLGLRANRHRVLGGTSAVPAHVALALEGYPAA